MLTTSLKETSQATSTNPLLAFTHPGAFQVRYVKHLAAKNYFCLRNYIT